PAYSIDSRVYSERQDCNNRRRQLPDYIYILSARDLQNLATGLHYNWNDCRSLLLLLLLPAHNDLFVSMAILSLSGIHWQVRLLQNPLYVQYSRQTEMLVSTGYFRPRYRATWFPLS